MILTPSVTSSSSAPWPSTKGKIRAIVTQSSAFSAIHVAMQISTRSFYQFNLRLIKDNSWGGLGGSIRSFCSWEVLQDLYELIKVVRMQVLDKVEFIMQFRLQVFMLWWRYTLQRNHDYHESIIKLMKRIMTRIKNQDSQQRKVAFHAAVETFLWSHHVIVLPGSSLDHHLSISPPRAEHGSLSCNPALISHPVSCTRIFWALCSMLWWLNRG